MKPETKLWHELKRITPKDYRGQGWKILALLGTPDLLGYNTNWALFYCRIKGNIG